MSPAHFSAAGRPLVVLASLLAYLTACTQVSAGMLSINNPVSATPVFAQVEIAGVEENATISFAGNESDRQRYEALMAEFHRQNPDIRVQFVAWPETVLAGNLDAEARLRQMAAVADTMVLGELGASSVTYSFRDLQPLMSADAGFEPADFWPGVLEACQDAQGRALGLPLGIGFQGIFYDRSAFDTAGLAYPQPGWTLDEFRQTVTALAGKPDVTRGFVYAESFPMLPSSLIGAILADEMGEITAGSLQDELRWYLDLVRAQVIYLPSAEGAQRDYENGLPEGSLDELFGAEKAPLLWPGDLGDDSPVPGANQAIGKEVPFAEAAFRQTGFAPFPAFPGFSEERSSPAWAQCAVISRGSPYPYQSWKWLDFLSRHWLAEGARREAELAIAPARISTAEASDYWQQFPVELHPSIRYILEHAWYEGAYRQSQALVVRALWQAGRGGDFAIHLAEAQAYLASQPPAPTEEPFALAVSTLQPTLTANVSEVRYFYDTFGSEAKALEMAAGRYNQLHPDVKVSLVTGFSFDPSLDRLPQLSAQFDCFTAPPFNGQVQDLEQLLALDGLWEAEARNFSDDFSAANLELYRYDGQLYALPAVNDVQVMAYNADLLARRGMKPPAGDWSFDDFIKMVSEATSTHPGDRSYGFLFNPLDDLFLAGRGTFAADFRAEPPDVHFDAPGFSGTLAWLRTMQQDGAFFLAGGDWAAQQQVFLDGQIAFWTMMLSDPGDLFAGQRPAYSIGVVPLPALQNAARFVSWGTKGHFISSRARDPQACWDWMKFLSQQAVVLKGVPARQSVATSPEWRALVGEKNAPVYREALARAMRTTARQAPPNNLVWPLYYWQAEAVRAALWQEDYQAFLSGWQRKGLAYLACMAERERSGMPDAELRTLIQRCARQADPGGKWRP